jgi:hypothetical protein
LEKPLLSAVHLQGQTGDQEIEGMLVGGESFAHNLGVTVL